MKGRETETAAASSRARAAEADCAVVGCLEALALVTGVVCHQVRQRRKLQLWVNVVQRRAKMAAGRQRGLDARVPHRSIFASHGQGAPELGLRLPDEIRAGLLSGEQHLRVTREQDGAGQDGGCGCGKTSAGFTLRGPTHVGVRARYGPVAPIRTRGSPRCSARRHRNGLGRACATYAKVAAPAHIGRVARLGVTQPPSAHSGMARPTRMVWQRHEGTAAVPGTVATRNWLWAGSFGALFLASALAAASPER